MSEKKNHYYPSCVEISRNATAYLPFGSHPGPTIAACMLILGHLADRLGDLVLAVEAQTEATIYPPPEV